MMQDHRFSKKHIRGLLLIVAVAAILAIALKGIPSFSVTGATLPTREFSETVGDSDEVIYVILTRTNN